MQGQKPGQRKAEKSDSTIDRGGAELLDEFHAVFAKNMRDLGTPAYGRSLFAAILSHFPEDAKVHLVRKDSHTIAGAFSYAFGSTIEVPSASSLREYRALCPNHLLYWSIITEAISEGRTAFDFGRSTPDDGTYQFKAQWGARAVPLNWGVPPAAWSQLPDHSPKNPKFPVVIDSWVNGSPSALPTASVHISSGSIP